MQKNILIYSDIGASADSVNELLRFFERENFNAKAVSGLDLQATDWIDQTDLLIIPGGRSLPFYEKLGDLGNQNIIRFVKNGGCYLGFCAGAYYASSETIFAKGLPEELILPGALNFFKGKAIGPVFAAKDFAYQSEQGARVVSITISEQNQIVDVYFNGGCYFDGVKESQVIAYYIENNLPAIIKCEVGKGDVILSGVHPELSYRTIPVDQNPVHQALRKSLQQVDFSRDEFMEALICRSFSKSNG